MEGERGVIGSVKVRTKENAPTDVNRLCQFKSSYHPWSDKNIYSKIKTEPTRLP